MFQLTKKALVEQMIKCLEQMIARNKDSDFDIILQ